MSTFCRQGCGTRFAAFQASLASKCDGWAVRNWFRLRPLPQPKDRRSACRAGLDRGAVLDDLPCVFDFDDPNSAEATCLGMAENLAPDAGPADKFVAERLGTSDRFAHEFRPFFP